MVTLNMFPLEESDKFENNWSVGTLIMAGSYPKCTVGEPNVIIFPLNTIGTVLQQLLFQDTLGSLL